MIWWCSAERRHVRWRMRMVQSRHNPSQIHHPVTLFWRRDHNIPPVIIVTSHHHVCVVDVYMESIKVCISFEFSFLVRHRWVFYALRGFEGGRFAPSPIHCNACNAQHLNAPPPKLVDRHSPLLHPNLPNLQSKLPRQPLFSPGRNLLGI